MLNKQSYIEVLVRILMRNKIYIYKNYVEVLQHLERLQPMVYQLQLKGYYNTLGKLQLAKGQICPSLAPPNHPQNKDSK